KRSRDGSTLYIHEVRGARIATLDEYGALKTLKSPNERADFVWLNADGSPGIWLNEAKSTFVSPAGELVPLRLKQATWHDGSTHLRPELFAVAPGAEYFVYEGDNETLVAATANPKVPIGTMPFLGNEDTLLFSGVNSVYLFAKQGALGKSSGQEALKGYSYTIERTGLKLDREITISGKGRLVFEDFCPETGLVLYLSKFDAPMSLLNTHFTYSVLTGKSAKVTSIFGWQDRDTAAGMFLSPQLIKSIESFSGGPQKK
ncbi:MAG: hypothetical protein WC655_16270, partial [Candidatus Hydrogenedentales bacterium]